MVYPLAADSSWRIGSSSPGYALTVVLVIKLGDERRENETEVLLLICFKAIEVSRATEKELVAGEGWRSVETIVKTIGS